MGEDAGARSCDVLGQKGRYRQGKTRGRALGIPAQAAAVPGSASGQIAGGPTRSRGRRQASDGRQDIGTRKEGATIGRTQAQDGIFRFVGRGD